MIRSKTILGFRVRVVVLVALVLFSGGCVDKALTLEQILANVKQDREKGHYKSAIIHLKNVLQKSPQNAEARYLLGVTYNAVGDYRSAEAELRRAIDLRYERAKVTLGEPLLMMGEYQKVLDQVPLDANVGDAVQAEILTLRARASFGLGRNREGRELLEQALAKQPEFADALLVQAFLRASERKLDEASQLIERALASAPKNVGAWLMKGDFARANQDRAGALAAYQKVIEISPENTTARLNITSVHIAAGNLDDARKQLVQVRTIAPNLPQAKYLDALIEFRQKKYTAAREALLQTLKVAPDHLPALLLAGAVEYTSGAHVQAQSYLARVIERAPGTLYARKLLVASLVKSGQTQRAIELLQPGLQHAPGDGELMALAGEVYLQNYEFAKAVQYFEKAAKLDPKSATARTGLGRSRLAIGETDNALADLESAVELDPERFQADILLVVSNLQRARYDEALKALQSLEKKQPKNPLTYDLKADIYLGKNDQPTARKNLEHALVLSPTYVAAAMKLAQLDLQEKKPAVARRRLETILEKDKNNTQALLALASIAPGIGATPKELIDWLERAHKAHPDLVRPQLLLARAYAQSGDPKKALEVAQRAQSAHPDNLEVLDALGTIQLGAGANEQALATYNKLVALHPKSAASLYRLAMAQAANADPTRAANTLRKALSLQPDFIDAQVALATLETSAGRYPAAVKLAQQVQKQSAKSPVGFVLEGDIMMAEKKFAQAAKAYETAYGMGKNGLVLTKLHAAHTRAGKSEEAEGRLAQWLKESPDDAVVRRYSAEINLKSGKYKNAIEQYEWLLKKQPDDALLLNNLAMAYQQVKDARALPTAERAYTLWPNSAAVADTLGWILVEQGNTKRGLEVLQKAVAAAPQAAEPRYHLAQAFIKAGDRAKARQELERLLTDRPGSPFATEARKLLEDLRR